jgi:hypothetical protein
MIKQYQFELLTLRKINNIPLTQVRTFSGNLIRFSENPSSSSRPPLRPFSESTEETRSFLGSLLVRDILAMQQLDHIIEHTRATMRDWNNEADLTVNHGTRFQELMNIVELDIEARNRHAQSAEIIDAIMEGVEPPINSMGGWSNLRDDLDNSQDPGLDGLRNYVRTTLDIHITAPFLEEMAERMRTHRDNLPDYRSRDNSQCSDSMNESDSEIEQRSEVETNSSIYQSVNSNQESNYNSDSNSEDYQSANSHIDDLDHSSSDLEDNSLENVQVSSTHDNESDNQSCGDNLESNQGNNQHQSITEVDQCINQDESNLSSDKKLLTDDAPDLSDTFHMLFSDPPVENKSTIDFVLQKQQEEMPDIMDSDGGE